MMEFLVDLDGRAIERRERESSGSTATAEEKKGIEEK
jgi:hypothetical protein